MCVSFIHDWRDLQLNVDSFMAGIFMFLQSFCQKLPKKEFFLFHFDIWSGIRTRTLRLMSQHASYKTKATLKYNQTALWTNALGVTNLRLFLNSLIHLEATMNYFLWQFPSKSFECRKPIWFQNSLWLSLSFHRFISLYKRAVTTASLLLPRIHDHMIWNSAEGNLILLT